MKKLLLAAAALSAIAAAPATAAVVPNGSSGIMFTPFDTATQGSLLASQSTSGTALTFAATFNQAVYRNSFGTLDFYYQVVRTGPGSATNSNTGQLLNEEIRSFTVSNFAGYLVDAIVSAADPDGAGLFGAAMNGTPPIGSTTTTGRTMSGSVLTTEFGLNGLINNEQSATYIFRTNALAFNEGTFGIIDGSTLSGLTYQPTGPAVPEPASWAMMIGGFGLIGAAMRRRSTSVRFA